MKSYEFQIDLPQNHTRTYVFFDRQRAEQALEDYRGRDPRFNPTALQEKDSESNAIIVDANARYVETDLTGLNYVGRRKAFRSGVLIEEQWYAQPGFENEVKDQLVEAQRAMNAAPLKRPTQTNDQAVDLG